MKTGTIAILAALLLTGVPLAVANKACKSSQNPWCVRSVYWKSGKAVDRAGRTRSRLRQSTPAGSEAIPDSLGATKL
jgi:hypothetical protein